jgi:orotate phosphoribosyltransferase
MEDHAELVQILRRRSLFKGDFVLASGRRSHYYFDCKLTTLGEPRGLELACRALLDRLSQLRGELDAVGGLTIGAAPLVVGVSQMALRQGWTLPGFIVRKEPKPHGRQQLIEGTVQAGWKVAIVDDVITTGGSVLQAARTVEEAAATVRKVVVLVDREEGGAEHLRAYDWEAIFSFKDLLAD